MEDLQQVKTWSYNLGLLNIPLFEDKENGQRYVMLNGSKGNFCLDLNANYNSLRDEFRNFAWSSDVGHYISLDNNNIQVFRWDKFSPEIYTSDSVSRNLNKFQDYLQNNQPRQDISIINFIIRKFRILWNSFKNNTVEGEDVLKAFLYLLACAKEGSNRENLDINKWGLDNKAKDIVNLVRKEDWEVLTNELRTGDSINNLKPEFSLVLRHTAGRLFQEANYQAIISRQLSLPGILNRTISFQNKGAGIGIYYTPPFLARTLVEEALRVYGEKLPNSLKIFDPSCGSGEFLKEIIRQLEIKNYKGKVNLIGWDISESAIDICKFIQATEDKTKIKFEFELKQCDAIDTDNKIPENIDIVLMNPPFQSWELMDNTVRDKVKSILGNLFQKKPSLASAFLWRIIKCLKKDGIVACILPASIFDADSYSNLRENLSQLITPTLIARIGGHFIFTNATVHISMLVAKLNKTSDINPVVFWSDYHKDSTIFGIRQLRKYRYSNSNLDINEKHYSIYVNNQIASHKNNWVPYSYQSWEIGEKFKDFHKVKDIFEIRQGVRTGNPVFIISKNYYEYLPKSEQVFFRPAVLNESIKEGCLSDVAYLFYPYGKNISEIGDQEILLKKYVSKYYEEVLLPNKSKLKQRSIFGNKNWWELSRHRDWQIAKSPKLISTEFGKSGSFAWDGTGKYVAVRAHAWLPKINYNFIPEDVGLAYLAILSSRYINDLINSVSRQIGPTTWYLSSKYINEMPLPNLFEIYSQLELEDTVINDKADIFNELVIIGKNIANRKQIEEKNLNDLTTLIYDIKI